MMCDGKVSMGMKSTWDGLGYGQERAGMGWEFWNYRTDTPPTKATRLG